MDATEARQARAREKYDAGEYGNNSGPPSMNSLNHVSQLWPTISVGDSESGQTQPSFNEGRGCDDNRLRVIAGQWGTPTSRDHKDGACEGANVPTASLLGREAVQWVSPRMTDGEHGGANPTETTRRSPAAGQANLSEQTLELWNTPAVPNGGRQGTRKETGREGKERHLEHQASRTSRPVLSATSGEPLSPTTRTLRRRLNPAFVCWLMGWPMWWTNTAWTSCGWREMASYLSRQRWLLSCLLDALE